MEQTSNNIEHNMTDRIIEELVNHVENKVEAEVKQEEEVKQQEEVMKEEEAHQAEVKQEDVVNGIENTTNSEINFEEAKQAKTRTKSKPKSKPKTQNDTDTKVTNAEMKALADVNNQFYTLLNRIHKIPMFKDKLTKELLNNKRHVLKSMMKS